MEYVKAMKTYEKMCDDMKGHCEKCPLACMNNPVNRSCLYFVSGYPELAEPILEQWDKAHPVKTRGYKLSELFPNIRCMFDNTPALCPLDLDEDFECVLNNDPDNSRDVCNDCRRKYWSTEYEEPQK